MLTVLPKIYWLNSLVLGLPVVRVCVVFEKRVKKKMVVREREREMCVCVCGGGGRWMKTEKESDGVGV